MTARHFKLVMVSLLFLSIFTTISGDPACSHGHHVVYSRDQLVAFRDTAVLLPDVSCGEGNRDAVQG